MEIGVWPLINRLSCFVVLTEAESMVQVPLKLPTVNKDSKAPIWFTFECTLQNRSGSFFRFINAYGC